MHGVYDMHVKCMSCHMHVTGTYTCMSHAVCPPKRKLLTCGVRKVLETNTKFGDLLTLPSCGRKIHNGVDIICNNNKHAK